MTIGDLIDFLSKFTSTKKKKISEQTRICEDLGVDGDDVDDLFEELSKVFNVNFYGNINLSEYSFGSEGSFSIFSFYYYLFKKENKKQMTVIDLFNIIKGIKKM